MDRVRRFCFTLNNYQPNDLGDMIQNLEYVYIVVGLETTTNGVPHYQGYVELESPTYFESIKKVMPRAHIEPCKGNQRQNIDYCKKSGNFKEFGTPRQQGRRNDLRDLSMICERQRSLRAIVEDEALSVQALKAVLTLIVGPQRMWYTEVRWFYGPSGTGKTRDAMQQFSSDPYNLYFKSSGTKTWWQGYDGQPNVIIDDIRPEDFSFQYLLGLFDRYPFTVECKGGSRQFLAEKIIVTCPWSPKQFLDKMDSAYGEKFDQFTRRISEVKEYKK
jgi:Putative viral replication protein/RNA helicase